MERLRCLQSLGIGLSISGDSQTYPNTFFLIHTFDFPTAVYCCILSNGNKKTCLHLYFHNRTHSYISQATKSHVKFSPPHLLPFPAEGRASTLVLRLPAFPVSHPLIKINCDSNLRGEINHCAKSQQVSHFSPSKQGLH